MTNALKMISTQKLMPIVFFIVFALFFLFPNLGGVIIVLSVLFFGLQKRLTLNLYVTFVVLLFSGILATKSLYGEGNDFITYYFNVLEGQYPTWSDSKTDFFFWESISLILKIIPNKDPFVFFWIVNIISFFPYLIFFNYLSKIYGVAQTSKIASLFFILLLSSFSFWNLYGNYIRQAWVITYFIGIIVLLIEKRRVLAFCFAVVVAMSHSTGVLLLSIIPIYRLMHNFDMRKVAGIAIFCLIITFIIPVSSLLDWILPAYISSKLNFYASWDGSDFGGVAIIRVFVLSIGAFLFDYITYRKIIPRSDIYKMMYFTLTILVITIALVSNISKVVERLYYFVVLLFYIVVSIQFVQIREILVSNTKFIANLLMVYVGGGLIAYNLYSSLIYNPAYFNSNVIEFLMANFKL